MTSLLHLAKRINWFFTANLFGVAALALIIGAFNEPIKSEVQYWVSRIVNHSSWQSYDEAIAELDALDRSPTMVSRERYQIVLKRLNSAAKGGIGQAMLEYGELLCSGRSGIFEADRATGRFWIERAAIAGHPRAIQVACKQLCL